MQTRRLSRRCLTSWLVVVSLLFSQLALASYVCPALSAGERMGERMAAGLPCDGDDPSTPVSVTSTRPMRRNRSSWRRSRRRACLQSCRCSSSHRLHDSARSATVAFGDRPEARPPPDPVFLQTLRLRV